MSFKEFVKMICILIPALVFFIGLSMILALLINCNIVVGIIVSCVTIFFALYGLIKYIEYCTNKFYN